MSVEFDVVVSPSVYFRSDSGRFLSALDAGAAAAAMALADAIEGFAILYAPGPKSGRLTASIESVMLGAHEAAATADTPYAASQEKSAKPHDIPNSFGWGPEAGIGGRFAGKWHPGNPATRFLTRAAETVGPMSASIIKPFMPG